MIDKFATREKPARKCSSDMRDRLHPDGVRAGVGRQSRV